MSSLWVFTAPARGRGCVESALAGIRLPGKLGTSKTKKGLVGGQEGDEEGSVEGFLMGWGSGPRRQWPSTLPLDPGALGCRTS